MRSQMKAQNQYNNNHGVGARHRDKSFLHYVKRGYPNCFVSGEYSSIDRVNSVRAGIKASSQPAPIPVRSSGMEISLKVPVGVCPDIRAPPRGMSQSVSRMIQLYALEIL